MLFKSCDVKKPLNLYFKKPIKLIKTNIIVFNLLQHIKILNKNK